MDSNRIPANPFTGSSFTETGGTVYFKKYCERADIDAMLRLMEVHGNLTDYAAFLQDATSPEDRYLCQMRIVSSGALQFLFGASRDPEKRSLRKQLSG